MLLLEVESLACSYTTGGTLGHAGPQRQVLRDVTFSVSEGSCFGILGSSGSGKSTIARCVAGLMKPDGGTIRFLGSTLWPAARARKPEPRIQMVFQASSLSLDPRMRIGDSIEEGFFPIWHSVEPRERKKRITRFCSAVGLPDEFLLRYPGELSGGQRQRVAIIRSLAAQPRLLILDEPTSALDPVTQSSILSLLVSLRKEFRLALLYITHDVASAEALCDRIGILEDGILSMKECRPAGRETALQDSAPPTAAPGGPSRSTGIPPGPAENKRRGREGLPSSE